MCTVTFLPLGNHNFILTSNRDEAVARQKALDPVVEHYNGKRILFPKDGTAGGSWIGITEGLRAVVLLNGAFDRHERTPPYRHSRGLVVKEVLGTDSVMGLLNSYYLENIEPFTLIIIEWSPNWRLWEFRWDGLVRHLASLPDKPAIWSSSTLYTKKMTELRQRWFDDWLSEHTEFSVPGIRQFHKEAGDGDLVSNLLTSRGYLETVSVTTIEKSEFNSNLLYEDLVTRNSSVSGFNLTIQG